LISAFRSGRGRTARSVRLLIIALAASLFTSLLGSLSFVQSIELRTLDLRFQLSPTVEDADPHVVLILLDATSMDQVPFPVPREIYAGILTLVQRWGAVAVGFDIVFDLPSTYSFYDDVALKDAALNGETVFVTGLLQRDGPVLPSGFLMPVTGTLPDLDTAWAYIPPCSTLASSGPMLGSSNDESDPDGVYRRVRLLTEVPGGVAPSLPMALAWIALGRPEVSFDGRTMSMGGNSFQLDDMGGLRLRFHGPAGTYTSISLESMLATLNALMTGEPVELDSTLFDGAVVLIGYSAPALYDLKPTPYSTAFPGAEVLATAVDNLMSGDCLQKPQPWLIVLITFLVSALSGILLASTSRMGQGATLAVLPPALFSVLSLLLFRGGVWLDTVVPVSSAFLTVLAGGLYLFGSENRRKREVRSAFSQYLSPDVVATVIEHPETLVLGGDERVMTAFFSDIRGFTGISEKLTPSELVSVLNRYLTLLTDIILETGGTVDKFEGDAIIAFWGAPIRMEDHAARACRAALLCQAAHGPLNADLAGSGIPELVTRIGLGTGPMVVGNMGSSRRFDYTVMGSTVNLGSRLEGTNKVYGTSIMVHEETVASAGADFLFRELDTVRVVGQKNPVRVFELIASAAGASPELLSSLAAYAEALELYRAGDFAAAARGFEIVGDPPSREMLRRCREFITNRLPGTDWDGIHNLSSK
jgi:adenylate cyclase